MEVFVFRVTLQPKSLPGHATWTQVLRRCRRRHRSRDGDGGSGKTPVPNTKELMWFNGWKTMKNGALMVFNQQT